MNGGLLERARANPTRRLLLIKPSSLGDIVHAMPTLAALRAHFPQAEVTWLVKRQWAPLVEVIQGVDRVCMVDRGVSGWLGRVPGLRAARYDLVVDLQGLFRSGAMAWLCMALVTVTASSFLPSSGVFRAIRFPGPAPHHPPIAAN